MDFNIDNLTIVTNSNILALDSPLLLLFTNVILFFSKLVRDIRIF